MGFNSGFKGLSAMWACFPYAWFCHKEYRTLHSPLQRTGSYCKNCRCCR